VATSFGQRRERAQIETANRPARQVPLRTLVLPLLKPQRVRLIAMSISSILGGLAEAAMLVLFARIAFALASGDDQVTVNLGPVHDWHFSVSELLWIAGILVAVRVVLSALQMVLSARASTDTVVRTRKRLIRRYLGASWALQSQQREGRLQELVTTYSNAASGAVATVATGAIAIFNLAALLGTALFVSPIASIGAGLAALTIGLVLRPLRLAVRRRSALSASANLQFATGVTELTSNLQEVRIFQVEEPVGNRLADLTDEAARRNLSTAYMGGSIGVIYQGVAMFLLVGALAIAYATGVGELSSLGAIVLIMLRSLSYAQGVQGAIQSMHQIAPYIETLYEEEEQYATAQVSRDGTPIDHIGSLEFDDVSFEYTAGVPVLINVSFAVTRGEVIGVVGPSGAGKSTLVQLLLRLREPTTGKMLTNGHDVRELSLDDWYRRFTFVPQEARLFSGTVGDNIRFFREDVDQAAIELAAKRAHLHEEIMAWPLGYDTPVGERGGQLSGGQRQRLCIARALADDPDVIVLDEPTSSLDIRSDSLIRETLAELAPRTTVFVIAHRLSTLTICNRIMVIFEGRLQGFDEPARLEATDPFYAEALRLSGMR
jgi:ABC-type multidrug transport system fused ATPase/permease subunit